jgi:AraC-like DNA-binding protein
MPLEYLTNWRMYKATALLQEDDRKVFEVAKSVAYDSDASFSKAFQRVLGSRKAISAKRDRIALNLTSLQRQSFVLVRRSETIGRSAAVGS